ncbi:Hypothetical_protein [Hexamita inflata]|uniref:Hypothetical_protein n=1 Tax=Hexamita inflata TaxID=28002 RepID=A0AA86RJ83_9EUKA|nr:Hypothetical protein HINF_LOCUS63041 [Hexamita inflata]
MQSLQQPLTETTQAPFTTFAQIFQQFSIQTPFITDIPVENVLLILKVTCVVYVVSIYSAIPFYQTVPQCVISTDYIFEFLIVTEQVFEFEVIVPIIALAQAVCPDEYKMIFLIQTSKIYALASKIIPIAPPNTLLWSLLLPVKDNGVNDDKFELQSSICTTLIFDFSQQPRIADAIVFTELSVLILILLNFKLRSVDILLLLKPVMPPVYDVNEFDFIQSVSIYTLVTVSFTIISQAIIPPKNEISSVDLHNIYEYITAILLIVLYYLYQSPYQYAIIPAVTAHYSVIADIVKKNNDIFLIQVEHYLQIAIKPAEQLLYLLFIIIYVAINSELYTDSIENYEEHNTPADNPQIEEIIEEVFSYDQITECYIYIQIIFDEPLTTFIIIPLTRDIIEFEVIFESATTICVIIDDDNKEQAINPADSPSLSHSVQIDILSNLHQSIKTLDYNIYVTIPELYALFIVDVDARKLLEFITIFVIEAFMPQQYDKRPPEYASYQEFEIIFALSIIIQLIVILLICQEETLPLIKATLLLDEMFIPLNNVQLIVNYQAYDQPIKAATLTSVTQQYYFSSILNSILILLNDASQQSELKLPTIPKLEYIEEFSLNIIFTWFIEIFPLNIPNNPDQLIIALALNQEYYSKHMLLIDILELLSAFPISSPQLYIKSVFIVL